MEFAQLFRLLIVDPAYGKPTAAGRTMETIVAAIRAEGFMIDNAETADEGIIHIAKDSSIGCVLVACRNAADLPDVRRIVRELERHGLGTPIFLIASQLHISEVDADLLARTRGQIFVDEDIPEFMAKTVCRHFREHVESYKTPFFGRLVDYTEVGHDLWTCPGHQGGVFYRKSPIGNVFVDYLGEAVFRMDIDNSVLEMGDLLIHEGPALEAQEQAAQIFGADRTYFVLNGTSSSNKVVAGALLAPGDLVLFDRNNHKSQHHGALVLSGAIPIHLPSDRNAYGLIGPIDEATLNEADLRARIRDNPLVKDPDAWKKPRPFRLAIIQSCSYDGTIYNARTIVDRIGHLCEYILFDEAWAAFMKFHPVYRDRYGTGLDDLDAEAPGIYVTQSTHKQLAGFSQASQIHVKDAHLGDQKRRVPHRRFNESFLLHASTSPFYPLFASLDVGAQMMRGKNGEFLWDEAIRMGVDLRKQLRRLAKSFAEKGGETAWFFDPFVPDRVDIFGSPHHDDVQGVPWESLPTDVLAVEPQCWLMREGAAWHGYTGIQGDFAMTDPCKLTLLMPGFDRKTGEFLDHGIPAPVIAECLREWGIVCEKNDLYSILFLITPGLERSKGGALLSGLMAVKDAYDRNERVEVLMPAKVAAQPRYRGMRVKELCQDLHGFFRSRDLPRLQREQFELDKLPEPAITAREAQAAMAANRVDYVPIDEVMGRISATLTVVYPPGIGVMVPGERYSDRTAAQIAYFKMFEAQDNLFPGFQNEVQGVYRETDREGRVRYFTYVVQE
ncbi:MAG: Orn/Lys/Arg decarboxylase N-terminal domain-containing protein [Geminicoccaceae bacterium]